MNASNQRAGIVWFLLIVCLCHSVVAWALEQDQPVAVRQPNIVVVFIDDLGWGDFSCFGNTQAKTPAIDRLASEGIRFTQFYVNSPICSPSRVALTTGHYPQRWQIGSYLAHRKENEKRGIAQWLDRAAPTLPRLLQQAGYRTGHFGKWHMGGQRDVDDAPLIPEYGFDATLTNFEGMGPKLLPLTESPDGKRGRIWQDAERLGGPVTWMQRSKITGGYVDAAIAFIDKAVESEQPFYLNLWPDDVHGPYWPPVEQWADDRVGRFRAVLESMDQQLARLFKQVSSNPKLRDNTLILVCSDNGPEPGVGSAASLRGSKATLYEGGIRSPLIVWGPGLLKPSVCGSADETSIFAAFDLVPSLLVIAGVAKPEAVAFDGDDVSAALLGEQPTSHSGSLCWRRPPDRKMFSPLGSVVLPDLAIREGKWKLLCDYDGQNQQLFNLRQDPEEQQNLVSEHSEVASNLAEQVVAWHRALPADKGPALGKNVLQQEKLGPGNVLGRTVLAADTSTQSLAVIDAKGQVEWKIRCGAIHDLHLLADGHLLYQDGWTRIIELDAKRQKVWEYDAQSNGNADRRVEVHAFQRLADGRTMIVESGPARIIEVDRDGAIRHQVSLQVDHPSSHSDTRNARKTSAGTYLVAHEADGVVREYNARGEVIWEFDVPLFGKPRQKGHGPEAFGNQVYSAVRLDSGNTLIGTGNGHSVLEVTPAKEIVWQLRQDDLPGITLAWVTQVKRLPNGNTLLVNCHAGPDNPQIIEVNANKQVVWTFRNFREFGNSLPVAVVSEP